MASLSTPLLVALAAIAPVALIFGAGLLMFGHRRAGAILAGTVGALALAPVRVPSDTACANPGEGSRRVSDGCARMSTGAAVLAPGPTRKSPSSARS